VLWNELQLRVTAVGPFAIDINTIWARANDRRVRRSRRGPDCAGRLPRWGQAHSRWEHHAYTEFGTPRGRARGRGPWPWCRRSNTAGKAAPLSVDRILPRREGHVPTGTAPAFPDAEAISLSPSSGPPVKFSSASASFPGGLPLPFRGGPRELASQPSSFPIYRMTEEFVDVVRHN
jgi:hypothetical protein